MIKIRIGGVPEHFNLPWHLAIEDGMFAHHGIDLEWIMFPEGTGAMNKALRMKTDAWNVVSLCLTSKPTTALFMWGV